MSEEVWREKRGQRVFAGTVAALVVAGLVVWVLTGMDVSWPLRLLSRCP